MKGKSLYRKIEQDLSAVDMMELILQRKSIISTMQTKTTYNIFGSKRYYGCNRRVRFCNAGYNESNFHGLSKGIHDVDIQLTIHEPKPSIKNLAENRIYFEDGKLIIDGKIIELHIQLDESQIYEFESGYIFALCNVYAEGLFRDEVTADGIPSLPRKYQTNFYDQRKAYLSAESIQCFIGEVYEDGKISLIY